MNAENNIERSIAELFPEKIDKLSSAQAVNLLVAFEWTEEELERSLEKLAGIREQIRALPENDYEHAGDILVELGQLFQHLQYHSEETSAAVHKLIRLIGAKVK